MNYHKKVLVPKAFTLKNHLCLNSDKKSFSSRRTTVNNSILYDRFSEIKSQKSRAVSI